MPKRLTIELDDVESALLELMVHELRQNDPGAETDPARLVHDIVRSVLIDDYELHHERICAGERRVH